MKSFTLRQLVMRLAPDDFALQSQIITAANANDFDGVSKILSELKFDLDDANIRGLFTLMKIDRGTALRISGRRFSTTVGASDPKEPEPIVAILSKRILQPVEQKQGIGFAESDKTGEFRKLTREEIKALRAKIDKKGISQADMVEWFGFDSRDRVSALLFSSYQVDIGIVTAYLKYLDALPDANDLVWIYDGTITPALTRKILALRSGQPERLSPKEIDALRRLMIQKNIGRVNMAHRLYRSIEAIGDFFKRSFHLYQHEYEVFLKYLKALRKPAPVVKVTTAPPARTSAVSRLLPPRVQILQPVLQTPPPETVVAYASLAEILEVRNRFIASLIPRYKIAERMEAGTRLVDRFFERNVSGEIPLELFNRFKAAVNELIAEKKEADEKAKLPIAAAPAKMTPSRGFILRERTRVITPGEEISFGVYLRRRGLPPGEKPFGKAEEGFTPIPSNIRADLAMKFTNGKDKNWLMRTIAIGMSLDAYKGIFERYNWGVSQTFLEYIEELFGFEPNVLIARCVRQESSSSTTALAVAWPLMLWAGLNMGPQGDGENKIVMPDIIASAATEIYVADDPLVQAVEVRPVIEETSLVMEDALVDVIAPVELVVSAESYSKPVEPAFQLSDPFALATPTLMAGTWLPATFGMGFGAPFAGALMVPAF